MLTVYSIATSVNTISSITMFDNEVSVIVYSFMNNRIIEPLKLDSVL